MSRLPTWLLGMSALLLTCPGFGADPPATGKGSPGTPARDAQALAAKIDQHIAKRWADTKVEPAPLADDAEFLRRVYLDLAGQIPHIQEVRAFLDDKRPDKRQHLVEQLLANPQKDLRGDPRYVTHLVNVWRALLIPEASTSIQARLSAPGFEAWLRSKIAQNVGYDQMVRELLTAPVEGAGPRGAFVGGQGEPSPLAFYLAKENKPENLAASTARLFLGVRLECAQCHHHPFADWKREQFWSLAAFFSGMQRQGGGDFVVPGRERTDKREIAIPGTDKVVKAAYLDGSEPKWQPETSPRQTLAEWVTATDNPYFARAAVNRLWAHFFGIGLIDPVDEMVGTESTPSHPELLTDLAKEFAARQFDVKFLIRAITASRAYQLTSAATHKSQDDPALFARMAIKGLTAEQLYDSLAVATGYKEAGPGGDPRAVIIGNNTPRTDFLNKFANQTEKATEAQTSILQALSLMNGRITADATDLERSRTLAAVLNMPSWDTTERVEALYLATLSRKPKAKELDRMVKYVENGGVQESGNKAKDYDKALADVFWALLNSVEFILNH